MNFKKISALACTMTILGGMATATPVFAAENTQDSTVPVTGKIGRWQPGVTDPSNPDGSGGQGEDGEVTAPPNLSDINVTVPTSMTFDVVTNTQDSNPELVSGAYTVTNNGKTNVNMSGQYKKVADGGITLVNSADVNAKGGNETIELGLSLNYGADADHATTPFIANVKDTAGSESPITLGNGASTTLKFASNEKGLSDIKKEAAAGTFADTTKTTTGNLVLTFTAEA